MADDKQSSEKGFSKSSSKTLEIPQTRPKRTIKQTVYMGMIQKVKEPEGKVLSKKDKSEQLPLQTKGSKPMDTITEVSNSFSPPSSVLKDLKAPNHQVASNLKDLKASNHHEVSTFMDLANSAVSEHVGNSANKSSKESLSSDSEETLLPLKSYLQAIDNEEATLQQIWSNNIEEDDLSLRIVASGAKRPDVTDFVAKHLPSLPHALRQVGTDSWKATWLSMVQLKKVTALAGKEWFHKNIKYRLVLFKEKTYQYYINNSNSLIPSIIWTEALKEQGVEILSLNMESYLGIKTGRINIIASSKHESDSIKVSLKNTTYILKSLKSLLKKRKTARKLSHSEIPNDTTPKVQSPKRNVVTSTLADWIQAPKSSKAKSNKKKVKSNSLEITNSFQALEQKENSNVDPNQESTKILSTDSPTEKTSSSLRDNKMQYNHKPMQPDTSLKDSIPSDNSTNLVDPPSQSSKEPHPSLITDASDTIIRDKKT